MRRWTWRCTWAWDPKQSDQQVRGVVMLPGGSGVSRRVAVFVKGEKEKEAFREAGADVVGAEDHNGGQGLQGLAGLRRWPWPRPT